MDWGPTAPPTPSTSHLDRPLARRGSSAWPRPASLRQTQPITHSDDHSHRPTQTTSASIKGKEVDRAAAPLCWCAGESAAGAWAEAPERLGSAAGGTNNSSPDRANSSRSRTRRTRPSQSVLSSALAFAVVAAGLVTGVHASPVAANPAGQAQPTSAPLLLPHQRSTLQRRSGRSVVDRFDEVNGTWVRNSWSLFGRTGPTVISSHPSTHTTAPATASGTKSVPAYDDLLDYTTSTIASSASSASASSTAAAEAAKHAASGTTTSITVPVGWQPLKRGTSLYAVPIIITVSVVVAVSLVSTIVGTVVWRKRSRRRRRRAAAPGSTAKEGEMREKGSAPGTGALRTRVKAKVCWRQPQDGEEMVEGANEAAVAGSTTSGSSVRRAATAIAVGSAGRLRQRRRRRAARAARRAGDDEDDEMSEGLTSGSQPSVPDTLTQRLAARMRGERGANRERSGPSTVFSRDLDRIDSTSSVGSLSRTNSHFDSSLRTIPSRNSYDSPVNDILAQQSEPSRDDNLDTRRSATPATPGTGLPLPATSPHLSAVSSSFGHFFSNIGDVSLPAFGPPAYRPNSSTIQATTRGLAAMIPTRTNRRASRRAAEVDEERAEHVQHQPEMDPLLWPEEKRQLQANRRAQDALPATAPADDPHDDDGSAPPEHEGEADRPQIDRSEYAAHLATDDKAVLARLSEQARYADVAHAAGSSSRSRAHLMAEATAPAAEDELELDEDGFERLPPASTVPTIVIDEPSLLPAPSHPVILRSNYSPEPFSSNAVSTSAAAPHEQLQQPLSVTALGKRAEARRSAVELPDEHEHDDESFLPVYLPRATELATAPPADDDEYDDDDDDLYAHEEHADDGEEGLDVFAGREEHAVI